MTQPLVLPATPNQARYVKAELSGVGSYMIPMGHLVSGALDVERLKCAARDLVVRHAALRSVFKMVDGQLYAAIGAAPDHVFHSLRMDDPGFEAFRNTALPLVFSQVDPFRPGALIRFIVADYGTSWRFTIAAHHAITDGFSRGVLNKELLKLYVAEALPDVASYYDFAANGPPDHHPDKSSHYVAALPKPARLISDGAQTQKAAAIGKSVDGAFDIDPAHIRALSKRLGATQFGVLGATYGLGLRGFTGSPDISSFFQTEGRKALDAPNSVVGPFSNTMPLDLGVDLDTDFAQFARTVSQRTHDAVALEHDDILNLVIADQKAPSVSINMFPPAAPIRAGDLIVGAREFLDRRTEFDLNLVWSTAEGRMTARAFIDESRLSDGRTHLFLNFQNRLLAACLENPDRPCRDILTAARKGHRAALPLKATAPPPDRALHCAFFDWARRTPDRVAITTADADLTYGDLAQRALNITGGLQKAGVTPDTCVVIYAKRHPDLVAAMLGISASGATFAVLDETYPEARLAGMIDQLGARYVVEAGATMPAALRDKLICITPVSAQQAPKDPPENTARPIAFHLFTSGSTGTPKLVSQPGDMLQRFMRWQVDTINLDVPIVTALLAGLSHDPTMRDVMLPLSNGGRIAIPKPCELLDPDRLRQLISTAQCNILRLGQTPSRLLSTGLDQGTAFEHVRAIFWGGERLGARTVQTWQTLAPHARHFNVFGTTETPQAFLINEIDDAALRSGTVALGSTLPWTGARLVDDAGHTVARGEVGEIVAVMPDQIIGTSRKFPENADPQTCEHYTGDLGFQDHDGRIHYIGRKDFQIKINGYRVEPGEIEVCAEGLADVRQACAILDGTQVLLFVVPADPDVTSKAIRAALSRSLPGYMLPGKILLIDAFPLIPNGKVDRAALLQLAPATDQPLDTDRAARPLTTLETDIATVFARRSHHARVLATSSLFDLGTDSLATIEVRLELEELGLTLPEGWQWMSVADLALANTHDGASGDATANGFGLDRVETFVILRFLAIVAVVADHNEILNLGGASLLLFVIAGFSFGRLQLPAILTDRHAGRVWALLMRLLVPLVPITLLSMLLIAIRDGQFEFIPSVFLFYLNFEDFIDGIMVHRAPDGTRLMWLWFIHAYLQMFLLIGLLLSVQSIRRVLLARQWIGLAVFFILAEGINLLALAGALQFGQGVDATARLMERLPTTLLPFLAIGAVFAAARTSRELAFSMGLACLHYAVLFAFYKGHAEPWWLIGITLCVFLPFLSLPRQMSRIVLAVAGYSLMIYLTHIPVLRVLEIVLGTTDIARVLSMSVQLCVGVAFGTAIRPLYARLNIRSRHRDAAI